jgi:hypothetical protein
MTAGESGHDITLYEMSEAVRHYEIAFSGAGLARVYVETFVDGRGERQSTCRLFFDGDLRQEVMRQVLGKLELELLGTLPRGVCIVYRGHLISSFDYKGAAPA